MWKKVEHGMVLKTFSGKFLQVAVMRSSGNRAKKVIHLVDDINRATIFKHKFSAINDDYTNIDAAGIINSCKWYRVVRKSECMKETITEVIGVKRWRGQLSKKNI